jgi:hypothetical protein
MAPVAIRLYSRDMNESDSLSYPFPVYSVHYPDPTPVSPLNFVFVLTLPPFGPPSSLPLPLPLCYPLISLRPYIRSLRPFILTTLLHMLSSILRSFPYVSSVLCSLPYAPSYLYTCSSILTSDLRSDSVVYKPPVLRLCTSVRIST